jgi:hypothetical protein
MKNSNNTIKLGNYSTQPLNSLAWHVQNLNINFKRVYIPKTNDPKDKRVRPLGVPSLSYRVYLSMLNNILTFVRVDSDNTLEQHGYLPQKSILTAWKSIFNNIKNFQFIYEFDLKGFMN